jgi:hypothetical protein
LREGYVSGKPDGKKKGFSANGGKGGKHEKLRGSKINIAFSRVCRYDCGKGTSGRREGRRGIRRRKDGEEMRGMSIGTQTFEDIVEGAYAYVDKTEWIHGPTNEGVYFFKNVGDPESGLSANLSMFEERWGGDARARFACGVGRDVCGSWQ